MKNISKPSLLSLEFPLPPPDDQRSLITALNAGRVKAAGLRAEAAAARTNSWRAFEASVYAADPIALTDFAGSEAEFATAR
jgi:hypothetical protein